MAQMMNCIKFKPKVGSHDALYTAIAIYLRDYPLPDTVRLSAHDIGDWCQRNHNSGVDDWGVDAVPDIILIYPAAMAFLGS